MEGIKVYDTSTPVGEGSQQTSTETTPTVPFMKFVSRLGEDFSQIDGTEQEDQLRFIYGWIRGEVGTDEADILADAVIGIRNSFGDDGMLGNRESWLGKLHRYAVLKTKARETFNEIDNLKKNANSNTTQREERTSTDPRGPVQEGVNQIDRGRGEDGGAGVQGNRAVSEKGGITEINVRFN